MNETGTEKISKGTWVEIKRIVLHPDERAPDLPEDTRRVPLEMKVKGRLVEDAKAGQTVVIQTASGRILSGTLVVVNPAYDHSFGPPIPELLGVGSELREILSREASDS